jgi:hypothetical protein
MPETIALLLPILTWLASTAVAGAVASDLFTWLRKRLGGVLPPRLDWFLSSRIGARLTVMALACLISIVSVLLIALPLIAPRRRPGAKAGEHHRLTGLEVLGDNLGEGAQHLIHLALGETGHLGSDLLRQLAPTDRRAAIFRCGHDALLVSWPRVRPA